MDKIIKERQTGKTTELIKRSHQTGAVIVTANYQRAMFVKLLAKELGLDIPEPMSTASIPDSSAKGTHILIDDADDVLKVCFMNYTIDAITMSNDNQVVSFGKALEEVKKGKKIKRLNWNGKDQYVELGSNISFKEPSGEVFNPNHISMGNKVLVFHGTQGVQVGWLASQADMLSEDWVVFE